MQRQYIVVAVLLSLALLAFADTTVSEGEFEKAGVHEACNDNPTPRRQLTMMWAAFVIILCMLLTYATSHMIDHECGFTFIPEITIALLLGIILAAVFDGINHGELDNVTNYIKFDADIFFLWLLPPIIFNSGYNMHRKDFFNNIVPTLLYSVVGTPFSALFIGGVIYGAGQRGLCSQMPFHPAMMYGTIISSTDPVAVLSIFRALRVDNSLFSIVFGEAVLNNAISIVLYRTLVDFKCDHVDAATFFSALGRFIQILVLSFLIGIFLGLLSALAFKLMRYRQNKHAVFTEVVITGLFPWFAYFFAETFRLSGIVAILFCGIVMSHYTYFNLSAEAQGLSKRLYQSLAKFAETFVFVYLGTAIYSFTNQYTGNLAVGNSDQLGLIFWSLFAILLSRAIHLLPITMVVNLFRKIRRAPTIPMKHLGIMWWSGLRGSVAFALAATTYGENLFPGTKHSIAILEGTLYVCLFTIVIMGSSIGPITRMLRVSDVGPTDEEVFERASRKAHKVEAELLDLPVAEPAEMGRSKGPQSKWSEFDGRVITPFLTVVPPRAPPTIGIDRQGELEVEEQEMISAVEAQK